ncbi:hypothetical protein J3A83DRAFT_4188263 [Scleroderma citrinum]
MPMVHPMRVIPPVFCSSLCLGMACEAANHRRNPGDLKTCWTEMLLFILYIGVFAERASSSIQGHITHTHKSKWSSKLLNPTHLQLSRTCVNGAFLMITYQ